jgi:hypothetical protein
MNQDTTAIIVPIQLPPISAITFRAIATVISTPLVPAQVETISKDN